MSREIALPKTQAWDFFVGTMKKTIMHKVLGRNESTLLDLKRETKDQT